MARIGTPTIVGLDIGTTKVCTLVGSLLPDREIALRGVGMATSAGLRKGVIVDPVLTTEAVRHSAAEAERASGASLTGGYVYVGVTGDHVQSSVVRGGVPIARVDTEILPGDVDRATAAALASLDCTERDVLLQQPRRYLLDGEATTDDPVGLSAERLEVDLHVVTGERRFLTQVRDCVEAAGLPVDSLLLEAVATGQAVLRDEERALGVAVLDLGGGTTDVAVYQDGHLVHTSAIPVGGAHVTADLCYGLQAAYSDAEAIKVRHAKAAPHLCDPDGLVDYRNAHGEICTAEHAFLAEVVGPRLEELFDLVVRDLRSANIPLTDLGAGVVLSGGASCLAGILPLARDVLGVVVREAEPLGTAVGAELVRGPQYSTAVGLVRLGGLDRLSQREQVHEIAILSRMKAFWRGFTRLFS